MKYVIVFKILTNFWVLVRTALFHGTVKKK